jgi:hypothetical protein
MSPYMPFTCDDSGWTWPNVAWCLASLAPNLAPRKLISSANIRWVQQVAEPTVGRAQNGLFNSQHHWYGRARLVLTTWEVRP